MSPWHDDDGDEYDTWEPSDESYIELSYPAGEPNPLGLEGVTECWLVVDGEPVPGVVVTRRRTYAERVISTYDGSGDTGEMELLFVPEDFEP